MRLRRMAWLMLLGWCMTETDFILRDQSGARHSWFKTRAIQFRVTDGLLVLAFLAVFLGLVLLLSK